MYYNLFEIIRQFWWINILSSHNLIQHLASDLSSYKLPVGKQNTNLNFNWFLITALWNFNDFNQITHHKLVCHCIAHCMRLWIIIKLLNILNQNHSNFWYLFIGIHWIKLKSWFSSPKTRWENWFCLLIFTIRIHFWSGWCRVESKYWNEHEK